jgi:hypothetical protein
MTSWYLNMTTIPTSYNLGTGETGYHPDATALLTKTAGQSMTRVNGLFLPTYVNIVGYTTFKDPPACAHPMALQETKAKKRQFSCLFRVNMLGNMLLPVQTTAASTRVRNNLKSNANHTF